MNHDPVHPLVVGRLQLMQHGGIVRSINPIGASRIGLKYLVVRFYQTRSAEDQSHFEAAEVTRRAGCESAIINEYSLKIQPQSPCNTDFARRLPGVVSPADEVHTTSVRIPSIPDPFT